MSARRRAIFGSGSNEDRWRRLAAPPPRITKQRAATRRPIGIEASRHRPACATSCRPTPRRQSAASRAPRYGLRHHHRRRHVRQQCCRRIETIGAKRRTGSLTRQRSRPTLAGVEHGSATSRLRLQHIATRIARRIPLIGMKAIELICKRVPRQIASACRPNPEFPGRPARRRMLRMARLHLCACCRWNGNSSAAMMAARRTGLLKSAVKRDLLSHLEIDFL
ncbi:Uncharacterised protein [Burkholderia oklahomensis]|nr:hypothetical protein BG90_4767 [Burkholderia oklahomensis C6786]SUY27459.1 Uncharacterised protein [Burkholderia oklahomensis]